MAAPADAGDIHLSQCDGAQSVPPPARGPCSRPGGSPKLQAVLHPVRGEDDLTLSRQGYLKEAIEGHPGTTTNDVPS